MVKAKKKPLSELKSAIEPYKKILNIGCGGCVSVCLAGGQKEVNVLNAELALEVGKFIKIEGYTVERQCRPLYVTEIRKIVKQFDCLLSMACGAGVQLLAEIYPEIPPKVEYSLTEYGKTAMPVLKEFSVWGVNHLKINKKQTDNAENNFRCVCLLESDVEQSC